MPEISHVFSLSFMHSFSDTDSHNRLHNKLSLQRFHSPVKSSIKFCFVYMREGLAHLGEILLLRIQEVNTLELASPPRQAGGYKSVAKVIVCTFGSCELLPSIVKNDLLSENLHFCPHQDAKYSVTAYVCPNI